MIRPSQSTPLPALVDTRAAATPDRMILSFEDEPLSCAQLRERVRAAGAGLRQRGIGRGDRIVIYMGNCREFAEAWLGAMYIGALPVPVNLAYRGEFLRHQLNDSGASLVVTDPGQLPAVQDVVGGCPGIETVAVAGEGELPDLAGAALMTTAKLFRGELEEEETMARWDEPGTILYTSGTTGLSKGVVLSHGYLATMARVICDAFEFSEEDVYYCVLPMFHVSGLTGVWNALISGAPSVIDRRFSVSAAWDRVRRYGATGTSLVGPMLQMLWNLPEDSRDAELPLRFIGVAPVPDGLDEAIKKRYGLDAIVSMYGMTEAFPVAITRVSDRLPAGVAGRANPTFDVRIVDEQGGDVAPGMAGEIICRPRTDHVMFEGYFRDEEKTAAAFRQGFFHTGDNGRFDADENISFVDRKKDTIRRRGENISSFELENAIRNHPGVADVAVHAVASELGEDDVKVVIAAEPGAQPTPQEMLRFFEAELPRFAVPRYIEFVEEIPKNPVGRVLKFKLRERGVTAETWDREAEGR
ncbi:MAG: AMP-binding protein [bacterium]|nr:ATP-dependent acyl-CoA ligase [Deltaproteobacteria bacterium]MCP4908123.1 AMP-binding protein [bacterium]